jgi:hypothetical protein
MKEKSAKTIKTAMISGFIIPSPRCQINTQNSLICPAAAAIFQAPKRAYDLTSVGARGQFCHQNIRIDQVFQRR